MDQHEDVANLLVEVFRLTGEISAARKKISELEDENRSLKLTVKQLSSSKEAELRDEIARLRDKYNFVRGRAA